jgi:hypothetical protein
LPRCRWALASWFYGTQTSIARVVDSTAELIAHNVHGTTNLLVLDSGILPADYNDTFCSTFIANLLVNQQ